tara:strand:- start:33320 stop:33691 length:372 start_codon:yes stop_codon:yes gene_type:complete
VSTSGDKSRKADEAIAKARRDADQRALGYRERAMKMYPWVCGRCARTFTHANRHELTVHHRDHDHDNNPDDGSNWELLCLYCHDNEHQRRLDANLSSTNSGRDSEVATGNPFADLKSQLRLKK